VNAFLRLNQRIWNHLPSSLVTLCPIRSYGNFLHAIVRFQGIRNQALSTYFFRNRPELELIRCLSSQIDKGSTVKISVLGCSNGAEVYSILWTIRSARPDLKVVMHAVDISKEVLEFAQRGVYSVKTPELVNPQIFERITDEEIRAMFDKEGDKLRIKSWIKEGIGWHVGDAGDLTIRSVLGPQDMVVASNFLCHMDPPDAERCLRNIARLVNPGGYLFVSGIDLDVRTKVAHDLCWEPLLELMEDIHEGDPVLRVHWPWHYTGLEPFDKRRRDWKIRYAAGFRLSKEI